MLFNFGMEIIQATKYHKEGTLQLLDSFRNACMVIINPKDSSISTSAVDFGGRVFDKVISSNEAVIFLAIENNQYIGIVTVYKIPQIRKGGYVAEIEEMFVIPEFQGTGISQLLIDAVIRWGKDQKVTAIRLESSNQLERAHGFYKKSGFHFYGKAYIKKFNLV